MCGLATSKIIFEDSFFDHCRQLLFCWFSQKSPLRNSAANEAEAFAVLKEELDRYVDLLEKRKYFSKREQGIEI